MTEQVCLRNSDFQDNTISAFGAFRHDQDFSDVTLACVDGEQVEAHKFILASSSLFFLNLLRTHTSLNLYEKDEIRGSGGHS